jgi:hypothetical protein
MRQIPHWSGLTPLNVAENACGVLATVDPLANLIRHDMPLWLRGRLGPRALPAVRHWAVLGVGRSNDVLKGTTADSPCLQSSWRRMVEFMPPSLRPELKQYVTWKERYSTGRSTGRVPGNQRDVTVNRCG